MRIGKLSILALSLFALLLGCKPPLHEKNPAKLDSKRKTSYDHFGTVCFAVVYDNFSSDAAKSRFESAWREIDGMLAELESAVSVDLPGSDIERFNRAKYGEIVSIRPVTAKIVAAALKMYEFTGGAFNPAVANLVDLWGFSPRFRKGGGENMPYDRPMKAEGGFDRPDTRYLDAFRKLSDFSGVRLVGDSARGVGGSSSRDSARGANDFGDSAGGFTLSKGVKDIEVDGVTYSLKIDLGGIAKGYAADMALAILKKHGYEYGYVNLGLSSMQLLKRNVSDSGAPGRNMWAVSVSDPDDRSKNFLTAFGKNTGVSTSGTYDLSYSVGGRVYSHIIDPFTGEPSTSDIVSVTVLGPDAGRDDALSTALCVMGKQKAEAFMRSQLKDYRVAMIARAGTGLELVTNMATGEYALDQQP